MLQDSIDVLSDLRIRKSNGRIAVIFVQVIAPQIPFRIMRVSIDFDDKSLLGTKEVDDEVVDDMLPAKLIATELGPAKPPPQLDFKWGRRVAELICSFEKAVLLQD